MRKRFYHLLILAVLFAQSLFAQIPVIQKIEPVNAFPNANILISGSGFSSNSASLDVWFDQVRGTIVSSNEFSIEVKVPAQARLDNVTVINKTSRLSGQSFAKFMPSYSGEGFDFAKLNPTIYTYANSSVFNLAVADIDLDGRPDMIGSRNQLSQTTPLTVTNLILRMNQSTVGNISFTETTLAALNLNAPTSFVALHDLNGDGKPELIASRGGSSSNSIFILENTSVPGTPGFSAPLVRSMDVGHAAQEIGVADLNGDGLPEIVVTNNLTNDLYIFVNESASGVLKVRTTPVKVVITGAPHSLALELQDMDGDRKVDIVTAPFQGRDVYILKNSSTLTAFNFTVFKITQNGIIRDLTTADFDKNGLLDIAITSLVKPDQPSFGEVSILMNKSTLSAFNFDTRISNVAEYDAFGIDASDLNGDGFPDLIVACRDGKSINALTHNGNVTSPGFTKTILATTQKNWYVKAGDLDGDAKPDLVFTSFQDLATGPFNVEVLRNANCHKPKILNTLPLTLCPSQTITLTTVPVPGVTFSWSNGFTSTPTTNPFLAITTAATYTVTAIGEGGACSVASVPVTIQSGAGTLPADPTITSNSPVCVNSPLTLSTPAVSGATYAWTGPNNFTSTLSNISISSATIANAGIYSLTVKVGDCSSSTVTKKVDVVSFGSFAISSNSATNSVCQGQPLTLTVNTESGYTFQWIKDGVDIGGQTSSTLAVSQEGSYKVRVSNATLGCTQETNPVSALIYLAPVASFTLAPSSCVGSAIAFNDASTTDPRVTSITYAWDFGDNTTSALKNATHTYATAQAFNPKLTVSYSGVTACTNTVTKSITIGVGTIPVINATRTELCASGTETSTLSVAGTFTSYEWSTNANTATVDVTTPADYSVNTVDANGCEGSASITITEKTTGCVPLSDEIPVIFTPNGDSQNDRWVIPGVENKIDCTMNIFDARGRRIFQKTGYPVEGWDGTIDGKEVPQGTYYYVFGCPTSTPVTGSVLVVR